MPRFLIEGVWSGYTSSQRRVSHREITTSAKFAEQVSDLRSIQFTDNTFLDLRVEQLPPRALVREPMLDGYGDLIRKCIAKGVTSVATLNDLSSDAKARGRS